MTNYLAEPQKDVEAWNEAHGVGTPVLYWPGVNEGPGLASCTRGQAWAMPNVAVVCVEGYSGGIALSHIRVREGDSRGRRCYHRCPRSDHHHTCDRDPGHTWPHRDRQQKGTETCQWDLGPSPALEALANINCRHPRQQTMCAPCASDAVRAEIERLESEKEILGAALNFAHTRHDALQKGLRKAEAESRNWYETYQRAVNATDEFLTCLLDLMPGASDEGVDAYDQIPRAIEKLAAEANQAQGLLARAMKAEAERDEARAEVAQLRADQAKAAKWETHLASKLQRTEEVAASWDEAARAMEKRAQQAETERDEAQRVAATLRASRNEIRTKLNEALHAAEAQRNRLAERLSVHAFCDEHPKRTDDCPFCEDRAAYLAYVAAGGRDYRHTPSGRGVALHEIRPTNSEKA